MSELKVGFIGFGNMAQAMAEGFLRTGALKPEQVYACARNWEKLCRNTEERGMHACRDAKEVADSAEFGHSGGKAVHVPGSDSAHPGKAER